jgi:nucleotide-binding universal stress UspA family protein
MLDVFVDVDDQEVAMQRIVVGVDGSHGAQVALRWAIDEARRRGAALEVVHAWHVPYLAGSTYVPVPAFDVGAFEASERAVLDHAVDAEDTTGVDVTRVLGCDSAARTLLHAAKGADLLVVGTRGRGGFAGLLLGSVSHAVAQHAPCAVVVVPSEPMS